MSKQIRFKSLEIENFKTYRDLVILDLDYDEVTIEGPSGIGKTTILDAISWVLTGKDYKGKSTTVEFVNYNSEDYEPAVVSFVIEVKDESGTTEYTLGRKYVKQTAKKSHPNTVCFINAVEYGARNFESEVAELVAPVDVLVRLSNPNAFLLLDTTDKKKELLKTFDEVTYETIVETNEDFKDIKQYVAHTNNFQTVKKTLNREIADATKSVEKHSDDYNKLKRELATTKVKGDEDALIKKRDEIQEKINSLQQSNDEYDKVQLNVTKKQEAVKTAQEKLNQVSTILETQLNDLRTEIRNYDKRIKQAEDTKKLELGSVVDTCSLCNQELPEDSVAITKDNINKKWDRNISALTKESDALKVTKHGLEESINDVTSTDLYKMRKDELDICVEALAQEQKILSGKQRLEYGDLFNELNEVNEKLTAFHDYALNKDKLDDIASKRDSAKKKLRTATRNLDLVKSFLNVKMETMTKGLNGLSDRVKVQLFDKSKSEDDLVDKFIIYFKNDKGVWVPEDNCSGGEIIALGSELLKIVERQFNIKMPLLVDKSESTTLDLRDDVQVIKTVVAEGPKEVVIITGDRGEEKTSSILVK